MKKLLIAFLLFAAAISASIIKPVERFATENNKVRLSRITVDSARLEEYNAYLKEEIELFIEDKITGLQKMYYRIVYNFIEFCPTYSQTPNNCFNSATPSEAPF